MFRMFRSLNKHAIFQVPSWFLLDPRLHSLRRRWLGGYAISRQNNLELHFILVPRALGLICNEPVHVTKKRQEWLHLGYHTCKVLIELFHIGMPVVRTDGRTVTRLPKFLGWRWMGRLPHFLRYETALVRSNVGCFHFCLINEKPMIPVRP